MNTQSPNIAALARTVRPDVVGAIRQASAQTGVDFAYLLEKAGIESSFDPGARAETSSARGLYQFVEGTWLDTLDRHGARHGYPNVAAAITRDGNGKPVVANAQAREYILALRDDPRLSALMAAELARDNESSLEQALGREVGKTELYMAHFLGAGGAARFLDEMDANGAVAASSIVPVAAQANTAVFFEGGEALSLEAVFARMAGKFAANTGSGTAAAAQAAAAPRTRMAGSIADELPASAPASAAAILAAADPAFAALRALDSARGRPDSAAQAALRAGMANQLMTLSLLQAFDTGGGDKGNEWTA